MNSEDKKAFQVLMVGAGETYGRQITRPLLDIYFEALKQYSIEEVSVSFSKHLVCPKHGTFFPKPADLVRNIKADEIPPEMMAEMAWMQIEDQMRRKGAYGSLKLDDKQALAAVKSLGSWQDLCHTNTDKLQWVKKQFVENYMTFENTPVEMLPSHLPGIEDLHNQRVEMKKAGCRSISDLLGKMNKAVAQIENNKDG